MNCAHKCGDIVHRKNTFQAFNINSRHDLCGVHSAEMLQERDALAQDLRVKVHRDPAVERICR